MLQRARAAIAAVALLLATIPQTAPAQDVELRSFDGTVELEGNLIAYDGAYYQIETVYGPLTVSAEGVSCAGPGCPDLTSFRGRSLYRWRRDRGRGAVARPAVGLRRAAGPEACSARNEGDGLVYTLMRPERFSRRRASSSGPPRPTGVSRASERGGRYRAEPCASRTRPNASRRATRHPMIRR